MINIHVIRVRFMCILKISAIKSIKISIKTIVKITNRNTGIQNVLNCRINIKQK